MCSGSLIRYVSPVFEEKFRGSNLKTPTFGLTPPHTHDSPRFKKAFLKRSKQRKIEKLTNKNRKVIEFLRKVMAILKPLHQLMTFLILSVGQQALILR